MAFDPSSPPDHAELVAALFRDQFNALKALIDAQQSQIDALVLNKIDAGQLNAAILASSSAISNAVGLLSLTVSDPPNQSQVQTMADKQDELINALRRP